MSCLPVAGPPEIADGVVRFLINGRIYGLFFDPDKLLATAEEVALDDSKFVGMWGHVYRLKLTVKSHRRAGKITYVIKEIQ